MYKYGDSVDLQWGLLRLGSICVYNMLDRGERGELKGDQSVAIQTSIEEFCVLYDTFYKTLPTPLLEDIHVIRADEFRDLLKKVVTFRNKWGAHYGARIWRKQQGKEVVDEEVVSLQGLATAVMILHFLFLNCMISWDNNMNNMNIHVKPERIFRNAYLAMQELEHDPLPVNTINEPGIKTAVYNLLVNPPDEIADGNTANITVNFQDACSVILIATLGVHLETCEANKAKINIPRAAGNAKETRNDMVHMNYIKDALTLTRTADNVYNVTEKAKVLVDLRKLVVGHPSIQY
ncbi:hypothetical protein B484DRAFT_390191 [Ochromonadaceae sp. CCMP2298]|nr:hypothetical protein B484DRAFT_390191 [Ochromonadaceae sp. CCMP2298]